jgi:sulfate adenylyltransferase subunit 1 (EFTu-like GTPase family)
MDLVDYSEDDFLRVREQFMGFAERLEGLDIRFVPLSALTGANVGEKSPLMPWYQGASLLHTLETVYARNDANHVDARFPVQTIIAVQDTVGPDFRGYAGQVASGVFRTGDEITRFPYGDTARIRAIHGPGGSPISQAFHPMSVVLELDTDLAIRRGDMLTRVHNRPVELKTFDMILCWLGDEPLDPARRYALQQTTRTTRCHIDPVRYKFDIVTLHRSPNNLSVAMNDVARVQVKTVEPIFCDPYKKNRQTGAVLIVDELTHATVGAGMIL